MKGYLIVENIPEGCEACILKHKIENGYEYCGAHGYGFDFSITRYDIDSRTGKPIWCPIKSFPEKQFDGYSCDEYCDGWDDGWDDCLSHILGEYYER